MIKIKVWGDGSCHNKRNCKNSMGIGIVIEYNNIYSYYSKFVGYGTSNIAEWEALITAFAEISKISNKHEEMVFFTYFADSQLIVNQWNKEYSNFKFKLQQMRAEFWHNKLKSSDILQVVWVRREFNKKADLMSKLGNPYWSKKDT